MTKDNLRDKPVKVGTCKFCNNPIYQWKKIRLIQEDIHDICQEKKGE